MANDKKRKNGTIEFLRFIFCMCVLLYHIEKYILGASSLTEGIHLAFFPHGSIGVEFFFVLTGLFMAQSVDKELRNHSNFNLGDDTIRFMFKKIKSIFPYHLIAFCFLFIITAWVNHYSISMMISTLVSSIPNLLLIQMTGIPGKMLNHVEWYLSVMLIVLAILYPLCKKFYSTFVKVICPIGSLLILGYLGGTYGSLTGVAVWTGVAYKGFWRGLAEIALGVSAYEASKKLNAKGLNKKEVYLLSGVEVGCYLSSFIFVIMTFSKGYEFLCLLALYVGIILSYSSVTMSKNLFSHKISYLLGELSLPIYLSQLSAFAIVQGPLADYQNSIRIVLVLVITFVLAIITKWLGDFCIKKLNERMGK